MIFDYDASADLSTRLSSAKQKSATPGFEPGVTVGRTVVLAGRLVSWPGWPGWPGWPVGLVGQLAWLASWPVGLVGQLAWLAGWPVGQWAGWPVGQWASWPVYLGNKSF